MKVQYSEKMRKTVHDAVKVLCKVNEMDPQFIFKAVNAEFEKSIEFLKETKS